MEGNVNPDICEHNEGPLNVFAERNSPHPKVGVFSADKVTLRETAINNKVLRVSLLRIALKGLQNQGIIGRKQLKIKLLRENLQDLHNYHKEEISKRKNFNGRVSSFGRIIKTKIMSDFQNSLTFPMLKESFVDNTLKEKMNSRLQSLKSKSFQNDLPGFKLTSINAIRRRKIPLLSMDRNPYNRRNSELSYYLTFPSINPPQEGRLNYDFNKLVKDVKTMKLPAPEWRIKIMIKKKAITGIVFTDKKELERCVTFSLRCDNYKVAIDNKPVLLLGAPLTIDNVSDLEILLDIVENLKCEDQMIIYK